MGSTRKAIPVVLLRLLLFRFCSSRLHYSPCITRTLRKSDRSNRDPTNLIPEKTGNNNASGISTVSVVCIGYVCFTKLVFLFYFFTSDTVWKPRASSSIKNARRSRDSIPAYVESGKINAGGCPYASEKKIQSSLLSNTATHSLFEQQFAKTCTVCGSLRQHLQRSSSIARGQMQLVVEGRYGLTAVPFSMISFAKPVDKTACC